MKFSELYSINEKFTGKFSSRDFGDAIPTVVDTPDYVEKGSRMETYVHSFDVVHTFVFAPNDELSYLFTGTLKNPIVQVYQVKNDKDSYMLSKMHPSDPEAHSDYSGVEPIKPPFNGYTGPYHIPKEFNMKKFNEYGSFAGIRKDDDWTLN